MVQSTVMRLLNKHEDLNLNSQPPHTWLDASETFALGEKWWRQMDLWDSQCSSSYKLVNSRVSEKVCLKRTKWRTLEEEDT